MSELEEKLNELEKRLDELLKTQIAFQKGVIAIRSEIRALRAEHEIAATRPIVETSRPPVRETPRPADYPKQTPLTIAPDGADEPPKYSPPKPPPPPPPPPPQNEPFNDNQSKSAFSDFATSYADSARANLEEFIGENLISKIGIIILVLGIGIGAKYAIDNNLISPLTRVVLAYILSFGLVGLAIKLKPKYHNFSAVLISGGMAAMYFVTYFAYAAYGLIPQSSAFALMALFTAFTVAAAWIYARQVIAHIGLVGAYAVPFLLSDNSGNYAFLFAYMAIVNAGVLAVSVLRYWKPIFYTSSAFTWLIYAGWLLTKYSSEAHFALALAALGAFFVIFYATKVFHGVKHAEIGDEENLFSVALTAVVFYLLLAVINSDNLPAYRQAALFSYLAVASLAVIVVSYRLYGRALIFLAFAATWFIYAAWFLNWFLPSRDFALASVFAAVYFAIFYVTTLVCRLYYNDVKPYEGSALLLANSFLFYGFGYAVMNSRETLHPFMGIYTIAHAALHLAMARIAAVVRPSVADVGQTLAVLVLTFATIAVPIQFDGIAVTMIWAVEAALLFWFARSKQIETFEYYSLPVMLIAVGSMLLDWITLYGERTPYPSDFNRLPFANGEFVTGIVLVAAAVAIFLINRKREWPSTIDRAIVRPLGMTSAAVAVCAAYNLFRLEISNFYHLRLVAADAANAGWFATDTGLFNIAWQLNFTIAFIGALVAANLKKLRSRTLAFVSTGLAVLIVAVFVTGGMGVFAELRESYVEAGNTPIINVLIRYASYVLVAGLMYLVYEGSKDEMLYDRIDDAALEVGFDALLSVTIFITASCELVNLMNQFGLPEAYKLGLSVLWGIFSLALIAIGIAKHKKHLRISAFVLLAVTLAKLFFYDVANLETIPKTILFVSLGGLMLLVSFLYNKYRTIIFGEAD